MKKIIALALVIVMCLSFAACGNKEDYSGKWVAEEWTVEKTGAIVNATLELYDDGTFKESSTSSIDGYKELRGSWTVKGDEIKLEYTRLVGGKDLGFGADGRLEDGLKRGATYEIIDAITLNRGDHYYNKEH
jgi:hypothetical protein